MYYDGKDYEVIDHMALSLRIDYDHFEQRLDVFKLAKQLNITLVKYSSLSEEQLRFISGLKELKDGFSAIKKSNGNYESIIYYNDKVDSARIRLTIAHEIKHIVFMESNPSEKDEALANHFARYILAPTCLVMQYVAHFSEFEISEDFDISYEAACNAYNAAKKRVASKKANLDDYEKEFIALVKSQS